MAETLVFDASRPAEWFGETDTLNQRSKVLTRTDWMTCAPHICGPDPV